MKYFVENNADLRTKDHAGDTPLHTATLGNQTDVVKYLVGQGANLGLKNAKGDTPLQITVANKSLELEYLKLIERLDSKDNIRSRRSFQLKDRGASTINSDYATSGASGPSFWMSNLVDIFKTMSQLKFPSLRNEVPKLLEVDTFNIPCDRVTTNSFNLDGALLLGDLIARKISGGKYPVFFKPDGNITLEAGNRIINSINTFESTLDTKRFNNSFEF